MPRHPYPKYEPQPFWLNVFIEGKQYRLQVLQTLKGLGEEHYAINARNKTMVFSTNRPVIERMDLKDFPWTWKLIKGELSSQPAYDAIVMALEKYLREKKY